MDARVRWNKGLSFSGEAEGGQSVRLGGEASTASDEEGFRPMEMIAIGIAGCTAMDVISILTKKRQKVTQFEVQIHTQRAQDHPKVFTEINLEYVVAGDHVEESAVQRAIQLSEERYCPAIAMFRQVAPVSFTYRIEEVD
jgi:putative redox protein